MGTHLTRWIAIVLAALLLHGCGFHLRGTAIPAEMMTMRVVGDPSSDFYRMVTTRLKAAGVTLVEQSDVVVLTLGAVGNSSQVASVNTKGMSVEQILGFSSKFTISKPGQPAQVFPINFNRTFLVKGDAALASSREQAQLNREMQEQAANQVIRQLSQIQF